MTVESIDYKEDLRASTSGPIVSSGDVLLDMNCDGIGVTFAQHTGGQNLNFAIPVDYVRSLFGKGQLQLLAEIAAIGKRSRRSQNSRL